MPIKPTADHLAAAARSFDTTEPLTFLRHAGPDDVYHRGSGTGGALLVIPGLWDTMPEALFAALRSRRRANVTGRCPQCDAAVDIMGAAMHHDSDCIVGDEHLRPAIEAWVWQVGAYARGRRIVEDPA